MLNECIYEGLMISSRSQNKPEVGLELAILILLEIKDLLTKNQPHSQLKAA